MVFQPKHMTAERLQALLAYAWECFYRDESQNMKMANLFQRVMRKEKADGTLRPRNRALTGRAFGRPVSSSGND